MLGKLLCFLGFHRTMQRQFGKECVRCSRYKHREWLFYHSWVEIKRRKANQ